MLSRITSLHPKRLHPKQRRRARFAPVAALFLIGLTSLAAPAHAQREETHSEPQETGGGHGTYHMSADTEFDIGTFTVGNINKVFTYDHGSSSLDSLDSQLIGRGDLGSDNFFGWATGLLEYTQGSQDSRGNLFGGVANITINGGATVHGENNSKTTDKSFAAGMMAFMGNNQRGQLTLSVNNFGTVSGAVYNHDGVAAGLLSYVNNGDQYIRNNGNSNFQGYASWYTSAIRAICNQSGNIRVDQFGSLDSNSWGSNQYPYPSQGWACGLDLQTSNGDIDVRNTGISQGTVGSGAQGSSEACGAYIFASNGGGAGNMHLRNEGRFIANAAPNGSGKGVYCGGAGNNVNIENYNTMWAGGNGGNNAPGYGLDAEIDGPGTMSIINRKYAYIGTNFANAVSYGLYVVSTTTGDPHSGGTGPVRIKNEKYATVEGPKGIYSNFYNGPITIHDRGTITGLRDVQTDHGLVKYAIDLNNIATQPDHIYLKGRPHINGVMRAGPDGSTLNFHIDAKLESVTIFGAEQVANKGRNLSAYVDPNRITSGIIEYDGGKTYKWEHLKVSGHFGGTNSPPDPNFTATAMYTAMCNGIPNGMYYIVNRHSNLVLAEPWGQTGNGTPIQQDTTWWGGANQKWYVWNDGNGQYALFNQADSRALNDLYWNTDDGAAVGVWDWSGGYGHDNEKWLLTPTVDDDFFTISPVTEPDSCIDVPYASMDKNLHTQLYSMDDADDWPNGGEGQQWSFVPTN